VVRLAVDGDPEIVWLDTLGGVHISRRGQDYTEAEVAPGYDPELVLQAALKRGCRVLHFEIADPSLEEIFIEHVGQIDTSERTLAPKAAYA
jgi:ABC-type uncharacterized transport system ATPase subunit